MQRRLINPENIFNWLNRAGILPEPRNIKKMTLLYELFMTRNIVIIIFLFTIIIPATATADWKPIAKGKDGTTAYINLKSIKQSGGRVYWWGLDDRLKPTERGTKSAKHSHEGDCNLFRYRTLSWSFHKKAMGEGVGRLVQTEIPNWKYPKANSVTGYILKTICAAVK